MRQRKVKVEEASSEPEDLTAWILQNGFADFVLMHTNEIVSGHKKETKILTIHSSYVMFSYPNLIKLLSMAHLIEIHVHAWVHLFPW
jgi:hypothetical protein